MMERGSRARTVDHMVYPEFRTNPHMYQVFKTSPEVRGPALDVERNKTHEIIYGLSRGTGSPCMEDPI